MNSKRQKQQERMKLNTMIDIEETKVRIKLKQEADDLYRLELLASFWPGASLRQINNLRKINFK